MTGIYLHATAADKLLYCDSAVPLQNVVICDMRKKAVKVPQLFMETRADGSFRYIFSAENLTFWSPENPVCYTFEAAGVEPFRFGLNELKTIGNTTVLVNDQPFFFRGYIRGIVAHDHPNLTLGSDYESYLHHIRQAKKYGFNFVRFHSTIPSEDFVRAADELGLFIHMEIGFAYEMDAKGNKKNLALDNANWRETILRYRNNPSVAIFCIGNEMHNSGHQPLVAKLYQEGKALAPAKLIMDNSGWGEFDRTSADIFSQHIAYYFPYKVHRDMFKQDFCWHMNGSAYDTPMNSGNGTAAARRYANPVRPTLAHEAIHYIEIPDYDKLNAKFDAFAAKAGDKLLAEREIKKPRFMTDFPVLVKTKGIEERLPDYRTASQEFKKFGIKTYIERLRLSQLIGFEMLQFADCFKYENKNGIVDCFDDDKYFDAAWMREFNADTVLLTDLPEECFYDNETIPLPIHISHFGTTATLCGTLRVTATNRGKVTELYNGEKIVAVPGVQKLVDLSVSLPEVSCAEEYEIKAEYTGTDFHFTNSWKIWRYPHVQINAKFTSALADSHLATWVADHTVDNAPENGVVLRDRLDDALFADLAAGKTVVLFYHRDNPNQSCYWPGALERFKPCIWDRGSNLGGIIRKQSLRDALGCGKFFNAPLYELCEEGYKLDLDHFPAKMDEFVSGVDKPVRDRMKGIIHNIKEFQVDDTLRNFCHCGAIKAGKGTLIVTTFNTARCEKPSAANFFAALLNEAARIAPAGSITVEELKDYLTHAPMVKEDVMNHFWEIDNKPVEDTLFWEQAGLDLTKIR